MFTLPKKGLRECWKVCQTSHASKSSHFNVSNQVCTFHDGCKQGIDQQMFNRKSISRKITHPQSLFKWFYFLLKICWSIPCLHPSWKVHTWIEICASLNHRKKTKADGSRLIPRKHTETLVLLGILNQSRLLLSKNDIHQLLPYIFKRQP